MKRNQLLVPRFAGIRKHLQVQLQKFILTLDLFFKNELLNHSAAAAFFFILSVTPVFFLLLFSFDRYLASFPEASEVFFSFLSEINPNLDKTFFIRIGLLNMGSTAIGVFGVLNLMWAGCWILGAIQRGLAVVFPTEKARPPLVMNVLSLLILVLLLLFAFLATVASIALKLVHNFLASHVAALSFMQLIFPYVNRMLSMAFVFGLIFMAYRFVPEKKPGTASSMVGALLCAGSIILMHAVISGFYDAARFNVIYGVLGSLIITVLWVHFTFVLFFFFAQFTRVTEKIDILLLERMFYLQLTENRKKNKFDRFLFANPRYIFSKYARGYQPKDVLFKAGDPADGIFYIMDGQIGLYRRRDGTEVQTALLGKGEVFGETAYLLQENRALTAVAETEAALLVIGVDLFEELLQHNTDFSRSVIKMLSHRLRKAHLV